MTADTAASPTSPRASRSGSRSRPRPRDQGLRPNQAARAGRACVRAPWALAQALTLLRGDHGERTCLARSRVARLSVRAVAGRADLITGPPRVPLTAGPRRSDSPQQDGIAVAEDKARGEIRLVEGSGRIRGTRLGEDCLLYT